MDVGGKRLGHVFVGTDLGEVVVGQQLDDEPYFGPGPR